jgi:small-conductance mechanosensitive channel
MLDGFLTKYFPETSLLDFALFAAVFAGSLFVLHVGKRLVVKRLRKSHGLPEGAVDRSTSLAIERKLTPILYGIAAFLSSQALNLGADLGRVVRTVFYIWTGLFGVRFLLFLLNIFVEKYWTTREGNSFQLRSFKIIASTMRVAVWVIAAFILLDNLGVNITALLAGLGIGGIAIALAAQTILGDLFSAFVIFFDRPFEVGDYINIDAFSGTVEHIGIKTTRIRSLSGEQLVFSNSDLTASRLRNYKRLERRRINFKFGVMYSTSALQLKAIPGILAEIIGRIEDASFERAHFATLADYCLQFEVVYYVEVSDYLKYMDIQQEINLRLVEEFSARGIEFAYPTQTLFLMPVEGGRGRRARAGDQGL